VRRGFGIVGTGVIAAIHADAIAMVPDARLAAVTDVAVGAAAAFAAAHDCAAEPDLDALLARPDVDVVSVCVPSGLHAEVGIRAARADKHLVVEKPIDVTLDAADRLIDAARAAGVALTVISQHRFDPGLIEAKRLLDEGALGRLVLGEASTIVRRAFSSGAHEPGGPHGAAAAAGSNPAAVDVASHAAQLEDLLTAIEAGGQPAVTGESGRATLEIVCAVYESARKGRAVTLAP